MTPKREPKAKQWTAGLGAVHPKLSRGMVWCTTCGGSQRVDSGDCLSNGWPKCCGYTMTIDSPEERAALRLASGE